MKRTILVSAVLALGFAGGGISLADPPSGPVPGPNGNNTFGLCTAYFSGSENGQAHKRKAPPFQGLEAAAEAADQSVAEYCAANGQHPGGGNGGGKGGGGKGGGKGGGA